MTSDALAMAAPRRRPGRASSVLLVLAGFVLVWYVAALPMNGFQAVALAQRIDPDRVLGFGDALAASWLLDRPLLPTPDRIVAGFWEAATAVAPTNRRNILYHVAVTTTSTVVGFLLGALLGVALAAGIVAWRTLDASLMPWLIASQTIPILAIAPMLVAVLGALQITGVLPKATIAMYLCFFPVTVAMVKGLRSPDRLALDLFRTWRANDGQTLTRLRFPTAVPYLFASLKVAIALGLVGAMVGELSTGGQAGLGGRLLSASYNGDMLHMWVALVTAALLAVTLVALVGVVERGVLRMMGTAPARAGGELA